MGLSCCKCYVSVFSYFRCHRVYRRHYLITSSQCLSIPKYFRRDKCYLKCIQYNYVHANINRFNSLFTSVLYVRPLWPKLFASRYVCPNRYNFNSINKSYVRRDFSFALSDLKHVPSFSCCRLYDVEYNCFNRSGKVQPSSKRLMYTRCYVKFQFNFDNFYKCS